MAGMLEGKMALITGGARGIGREAALLFAAEGARVVASDLNAEGAAETVAMINAAGGQALSIECDVTDGAAVNAMVQAVVDAYGRLDCAFNNAGIAGFQVGAVGKKTADWPEDGVDKMIDVNLKSVWLCMRAELKQFEKQGTGGAIVNTASIAGLHGLPTSSLYVAAKHGVVGLTKTAAIEYATDNIRVNSVCPGYIETDMTKDTMARRGDQILARVPAKRMGVPKEIAEMVCWLASDRASFVTGANYNVDGGFVAS
ncbi:SDR family oxidoreductase [Alphaproteobacteria bacterium]|jgi:NAD(P)-dependent dehydrogenase (short-subunit alcohol dehydrogenase family)|nr:SDR family oxidoreductase [Alphaproteobacteria bacterium]